MKPFMTVFACLGLILAPALQTEAEMKQAGKKIAAVKDVALNINGSLQGLVVDAQGKVLSGTQVSVLRNKEKVATVVTNREGKFHVANLTTGIYEIKAGQGQGAVRVWNNKVAPPTAKAGVLIVSGATTARAQAGLLEGPDALSYATLGLAITGVVLGGVALGDDGETIVVSP